MSEYPDMPIMMTFDEGTAVRDFYHHGANAPELAHVVRAMDSLLLKVYAARAKSIRAAYPDHPSPEPRDT